MFVSGAQYNIYYAMWYLVGRIQEASWWRAVCSECIRGIQEEDCSWCGSAWRESQNVARQQR